MYALAWLFVWPARNSIGGNILTARGGMSILAPWIGLSLASVITDYRAISQNNIGSRGCMEPLGFRYIRVISTPSKPI